MRRACDCVLPWRLAVKPATTQSLSGRPSGWTSVQISCTLGDLAVWEWTASATHTAGLPCIRMNRLRRPTIGRIIIYQYVKAPFVVTRPSLYRRPHYELHPVCLSVCPVSTDNSRTKERRRPAHN